MVASEDGLVDGNRAAIDGFNIRMIIGLIDQLNDIAPLAGHPDPSFKAFVDNSGHETLPF